MTLSQIEGHLGFRFPERHKSALLNSADPIHDACDFLLPSPTIRMRDIVDLNVRLRNGEWLAGWPEYLIAFASNGCGDYFAYDIRSKPYSIIYIDPDRTIEENLAAEGPNGLRFDSFERWHESQLAK